MVYIYFSIVGMTVNFFALINNRVVTISLLLYAEEAWIVVNDVNSSINFFSYRIFS